MKKREVRTLPSVCLYDAGGSNLDILNRKCLPIVRHFASPNVIPRPRIEGSRYRLRSVGRRAEVTNSIGGRQRIWKRTHS